MFPFSSGKTLLAQATIGECRGFANSLVVKSGDLRSKWVGDPEKIIDSMFSFASATGPSILYLEEIENLFQDRMSGKDRSETLEGMQSCLLQNFDFPRQSGRIFVICCSNIPSKCDEAFLKRLSYKIYVKAPEYKYRKPLLKSFVGSNHCISDEQFESLVEQTKDLSISNLKNHVQIAKDCIEMKVSTATHFVLADMGPGEPPKWATCPSGTPGAVERRADFNFSNTFCPALIYEDMQTGNSSDTKMEKKKKKKGHRERLRLTSEESRKYTGVGSDEGSYPDSMYQEFIKMHSESCFS